MRKIIFLLLITASVSLFSQVEDPVVWKSESNDHTKMSVSPNDSLIAACFLGGLEGSKEIAIYDLHTSELLKTLENPGSLLRVVSFSYDGKYLVSAGEDEFFIIWNVSDWSIYRQVSIKETGFVYYGGINVINFGNKTYKIALQGINDGVLVYDMEVDSFTNKIKNIYNPDIMVVGRTLDFSYDDSYLAVSPYNNPLRIFDLRNDSTVLYLSIDGRPATFSPDGKYFAVLYGNFIQLYSAITFEPVKKIEHENSYIDDIDFSKSGKYMIKSSPIEIYDVENNKLIKNFGGRANWVKFTSDNKYFVTSIGILTLYRSGLEPTGVSEPNNPTIDYFPNPSGNSLNIEIYLEVSSDVKLTLNDMTGNEILLLQKELLEPGEHNYTFDITNIPSGAYLITFRYNDNLLTKKIIIER